MSDLLEDNSFTTQSHFQFSGANLDDLESSEYTLATIVVDISGSVSRFRQELESCVKTVVSSCKSSPRSENLLVRLVLFNSTVTEAHGFRVLETINIDDYDNTITPSGLTNLFDATQDAVEATYEYGKLLTDQDYGVNGVVYVITDGCDTGSRCTPNTIKQYIEQQTLNEEGLESMSVILIGVGYGNCASYLDSFKNDAELDQFVDMEKLFNDGNADNALAKLAGYISQSISQTSMALQNGSSSPVDSTILLF